MSTNGRIYLDFNATAPLVPAARAAIEEALRSTGNASSIHAEGRAMRHVVETARNQVAALMVRPRTEVVFTSGGTEGNALGVRALAGVVRARGLPRVVAMAGTDHPSLRGAVAALGWTVVPLERLEEAGLVAVTWVNHELGTLADQAILARARAAKALIHVDAVQAAGRIPLGIDADSLAISAHKIGGPQGIGAVALGDSAGGDHAHGSVLVHVRGHVDDHADAGHQERGRRPGTENVLGIAGFGAAAAAVDLTTWPAVAALGDRLEAGLVALGARIHGADRPRIGGTVNAAFPGASGESLVIALDLAGIAASTGAACTSGSVQPSPVLLALGYPPEQAREAIRFSLGRSTTADEIERVLTILPGLVERARRHR
jgi:cysteine desulfurase